LLIFRDFNLDEKIEALPSLSLEEFQLKKKARKKRSAIGGSPKKNTATTGLIAVSATTKLHISGSDTSTAGKLLHIC
jgi:hypothetical protein